MDLVMNDKGAKKRVGVVGARGHVGVELLSLVCGHPQLDLAFIGSRALAGKSLTEVLPPDTAVGEVASALRFESIDAEQAAARSADAVVLALPNELSAPFVEALGLAQPASVIVDLSADHRFDDDWAYGLVELGRERLAGARRISNPGCYATAAQLALAPLADLLTGPPSIFGVSGYSGAGTTPSPRNDPEVLRDNLLPYALTGHVHEREIGHHFGKRVHFMPHVASFFRGISLTIDCGLSTAIGTDALFDRFGERYAAEPLVRVQREAPLVREAVGCHHATIGGFSCDGARAVVVATLDNLLKGAASQALQNLNLALGLPELLGLPLLGTPGLGVAL